MDGAGSFGARAGSAFGMSEGMPGASKLRSWAVLEIPCPGIKEGGWRLVNVWPRHTFVRSRAAAATTVDSVHTRFTFAGLCEAAMISTPGGDELIDLVACFG